MSFVSIAFAVFFIIVLLTQLVFKSARVRHVILLLASYVFYGWWDWRFCFLMLFLTLTAYGTALRLEKHPEEKLPFALGVSVPLIVLGIFKYLGFFAESFCAAFGIAGGAIRIILPVGISFYTFQSLSYTIDVRRGKVRASHDFIRFALYIAFFPQLVAGPIVKASEFLPQLEEERAPSGRRIERGLGIFFFGMFKKAVLADRLSVFVDAVWKAPGAYAGATVWLAVLAYAFQIYFDFSGYSDMAAGCACCLGYDLPRNFDLPYLAGNVTEFWRRWHISLSTWLREYLYISLGGNRRGELRTYLNLFITMLLGGLWHGAGYNFILWGAVHGLALCVHKRWMKRHPGQKKGFARLPGILLTFFYVCMTWVLFRSETLSKALLIYRRLFASGGVLHLYTWALAVPVVSAVFAALCVRFNRDENGIAHAYLPDLRFASFKGALLITLLVGLTLILMYTGENPFIYFQF